MSANKSIKPMLFTIASTLALTFLPVIFSNKIITARYPSNAGNGIKLIKPTFIDKYANKSASRNNGIGCLIYYIFSRSIWLCKF